MASGRGGCPASRHDVPVLQRENLIGEVDGRLIVAGHQGVIPSVRTTVYPWRVPAGAGQEWLSGCHVVFRTPGGCAGPLGGWAAGPSDDGRTPGSRGGAKSELLIRLRNT